MEFLQIELAQDPENADYKADYASFSAILGSPETARATPPRARPDSGCSSASTA